MGDITRDLEATVEAIAMSEDIDGVVGDLDREALVRLWVAVEDLAATARAAAGKLAAYAGQIVDEPIVVDGEVFKSEKSAPSWTGWRKPELQALVVDRAKRHLVDPATGDLVEALDPVELWKYVDVATGRTKAMRDLAPDLTAVATLKPGELRLTRVK